MSPLKSRAIRAIRAIRAKLATPHRRSPFGFYNLPCGQSDEPEIGLSIDLFVKSRQVN